MEGNIIQLKEYHLNKGTSKDHTPVFPRTKASAIEGMAELLKDLNISGVTPTSDISDVNSPEKGKIYYEESTDKYYVYSEDKSSFVELGAGASVDPSDVMPTVTQTTSSEQSGGDNIITFTFPNGETTQVVIKNGQQGTQGNSGYTGAVGELEVVNNLEDGGEEKALSAEMGKNLKIQAFVEKGTFGDAYDKAKEHLDVQFPWLLDDVDDNGNAVKKMIWHIGDGTFVDAIGASITGRLNGVTIVATEPFKLRAYYAYFTFNNNGDYVEVDVKKGLNNFTFEQLTPQGCNLGECCKIAFLSIDGSALVNNVIESIDFGGFKTAEVTFNRSSSIKRISRLVIGGVNGKVNNSSQLIAPSIHQIVYGTTNLEYLQISGEYLTTSDIVIMPAYSSSCRVIDFSGLVINSLSFSNLASIERIDIRNTNETGITTLNGFLDFCNIGTLIIGDFDTSTITSGSVMPNAGTLSKLVCTSPTPPATNQNGIILSDLLNKATNILVPEGDVTINGVTTTILAAYQRASIWSNYSSKISTYPEGEY